MNEKTTNGVRYIDVRRRNFSPLFASFLDLFHIPNTQSRTTQLRPNLCPTVVFVGFLTIRLSFESANERPRKVNFVGVGDRELDDRANLRMQRGWCWGLRNTVD
jgi:hypothetical protein